MNKLLKIMGCRMIRDKAFLIAVTVTLVLSLYISLTNAPVMAEWAKTDPNVSLEDCYYNLVPLLGLVYASFVSLFLSSEYSDGTLRNKLIAGHSRTAVLMSFFLISFAGCLIITFAWLIGSLPGLFYFDGFSFGWKMYAVNACVALCCALLYAAVFTMMSLLVPNKMFSAVASLVLWFIMLFAGSSIVNIISASDIDGINLIILNAFSHVLPTCPAIQMSNNEYGNSLIDIIPMLVLTVIVLFAGSAAFKKKDLK